MQLPTQKPNAKRILLSRLGQPNRSVILVYPPYPAIGDKCEINGAGEWTIFDVQDETVIATIPKRPAVQS